MQEHRLAVRRTARVVTMGPMDRPVSHVWIALHGQGQLAARFARRFETLEHGTRLVVLPEGLSRYYVNEAERVVGASWMTREGRLEEIADYVEYLDQVAAWLPRTTAEGTRTVLGFSQGSATAWRWVTLGRTAPPTRLVIWGGEVPPDLDLARAAERLARATVVLVAGTDDPYCPPAAIARYASMLEAAGISTVTRTFQGGHDLDAPTLTALDD